MDVVLHRMSLAEYLAWEAHEAGRNEFWRGDVFAMVGGTRGHGRVVANPLRDLGNHLDDTPCQAFSENMKDQVGDEAVLYPDVFVTCDHRFWSSRCCSHRPRATTAARSSPSTAGSNRCANMR